VKRAILGSLILVLASASTVASSARPLAKPSVAHASKNTAASNSFPRDDSKRLGSDSVEQGAQQTRPRRVNPGAQPSPIPHAQSEGNANRPRAKQGARPAVPDPKRNATAQGQKGTGQSYTIQVGAFLQLENARRLAQTISQQGYSAQVVTRSDSRGKKWHCVRVGTYPDKDQARKTAGEIERKLKLKPIVRPSGSL
jgi:cell division septation protein DedD